MPNDSHNPEPAVPQDADLLGFLRGKDNPFDVFVTARQADAEFARWHVAGLHGEVIAPLIAVMERYRPTQLQTESDLPRSGMVVILGARGNGKTHTLLALREKLDAGPLRLLIAPLFYDPQRPFAEYLLHQLLRHFEQDANLTLHQLADALTRQILVQALFSMTDVQWLAHHTHGTLAFWRHLFGIGTGKLTQTKRLLIQDLNLQRTVRIADLEKQHELPDGILKGLALQYLDKCETGSTIADLVRRGLYQQLINLTFDGNTATVFEFLFDGCTRLEAPNQPTRTELVDALLDALLQLCLLARLPVLFAFDALEALLGDPPKKELCEPFFHGVANFCDGHRGVAFLFFAETGHWQSAEGYMSHFARQRFEQGVIRAPHFGTVSRLTLAPMTSETLTEVIAARVRPLLEELLGGHVSELPPMFPFTKDDLQKVLGNSAGLPLRLALQSLHALYDQRVLGTTTLAQTAVAPMPTTIIAPPPILPDAAMEEHWQQAMQEASNAQVLWSAAISSIHIGLKQWLDMLIAARTVTPAGLPLNANNETPGNHPTYGQITSLQVRQEQTTSKLGLGILSSQGSGMPADLRTKLQIVANRNGTLDRFILLWPRGSDLAPPIAQRLPEATHMVWNTFTQNGITNRVHLKAIDKEMLYPWIALPRWINKVTTEVPGATEEVMTRFVLEKTKHLLPLLEREK